MAYKDGAQPVYTRKLSRISQPLRRHAAAVYFDEIHSFCNSGKEPGKYIQKIERFYGAKVCKNRINPDDAEHAGAHDHNNSGDGGPAQSSGGRDGAVHKGGNSVGQGHDGETLDARLYHGAVAGKDGEEGIPEKIQAHSQNQPQEEGISQADQIAL